MADEEFVGELSEKATSVTIGDITGEGVRLSYNFQGTMKGLYEARHMETVDVFTKPDGTSEFEARGIDQTANGDMILLTAKGVGDQVSPTSGQAKGEVTFMTKSKKFEWLNTAKGRFEGTFDASTGAFVAKIFATR